MSGLLAGKVVAITGAGGGIGGATAILSAREGARVVASDIRAEALAATLQTIKDEGGDATAVVADLTQSAGADALVKAAVDAYGRLDGAFNNAGLAGGQIGQGGRLTADWDEDAFDKLVAINLKGTWLCMRAEIRQMLAQGGGGSIVNTASLAGITGWRTTTGYAGSKHGVVGITKTAALEYADQKIRFNAICPGYTDTDLIKDAMSRIGEQILARIPAGRLASPFELAQVACWLMSDRASYVTGASMIADGGIMAG